MGGGRKALHGGGVTGAALAGAGGGGGLDTAIDGNKPGLDVNGPINPWSPKGNAFSGYNVMKLGWAKNHLTDPNQFYPGIEGWLVVLERQPDGTYALDPEFFVDFHEQADGARPHEIHLPGGDCTTEIFQ